jgi:hypothetical protein
MEENHLYSYFMCLGDNESPLELFSEIRKLDCLYDIEIFMEVRPRIVDRVIERIGLSKNNEGIILFNELLPEGPYDPWFEIHGTGTWVEITEQEYELIKKRKYNYLELCQKYPDQCRFL